MIGPNSGLIRKDGSIEAGEYSYAGTEPRRGYPGKICGEQRSSSTAHGAAGAGKGNRDLLSIFCQMMLLDKLLRERPNQ